MKYWIIFDDKKKKASDINELLVKKLRGWTKSSSDFKYLFVIGGDGFFLSTVTKYINQNIKIIFINAGTLGFYSYAQSVNEIDPDEIIKSKNYGPLNLLEVKRKKDKWYCINDFSINSTYAINIEVFINDILLDSFKGNGVLVTTPMGSTARNKSLLGPILMPELPVVSLTEIEPIQNKHYHSLKNSIVINNKDKITIKSKSYGKYSLIVDGYVREDDLDKELIEIKSTKSKAMVLIKTGTKDWIAKLNYSFK